MFLLLEGDVYQVVQVEHHKPGKGRAVVRTKLRHLKKGSIREKTFSSQEEVEEILPEKKKAILSYKEDEDTYVFLEEDTYESIYVSREILGKVADFLKEGIEVNLLMYEGEVISIEPPTFVDLEVSYAEKGVRGDTVSTPTKEVLLETGAKIQVPLFIEKGDKIRVDLRTFSYVERVKS